MSHWPLLIAIAVLGGPTVATLGQQVWTREAGAHGPIILATGLWLLWRQSDDLRARGRPGSPWLTSLLAAGGLGLYTFGRAYDFVSLETAGFYAVFLSFLHAYFGFRALRANWFPLLYLAFIIPPPGWVIDSLTAPLKEFVSQAATYILLLFGVPIVREGVTLYVAQYQLLVEDACSGMNSLTGLVAISLFYIYLLRNASWRYSLVLFSFVVPIAIAANIIRIMVLVLLTYFFGDGVAQGFLHKLAGLFLFATALALVFVVDNLLSLLLRRVAPR